MIRFKQRKQRAFHEGDDAPIDPEERLIKYLLNSSTYEKSIRPGVIKNGVKLPLNVSVGFAVYRVVASVRNDCRFFPKLCPYLGPFRMTDWKRCRCCCISKKNGAIRDSSGTQKISATSVWSVQQWIPYGLRGLTFPTCKTWFLADAISESVWKFLL